jgi:hypothetical protein
VGPCADGQPAGRHLINSPQHINNIKTTVQHPSLRVEERATGRAEKLAISATQAQQQQLQQLQHRRTACA